jgi:selenocysteine lyase/cysteine desulfurase
MDEDYWSIIQNAFTVTRGIVNLNNGGVSPSPRIVTEALVRYIWQQEDATAYTMWQILEPQSETIRTGLAEMFGCDREEIAITRNASESLEILLMGMDFKPGDEILTTTQDYPRMVTTLKQRERREGLVLKMVKIPIPPKDLERDHGGIRKRNHSPYKTDPGIPPGKHHRTNNACESRVRNGTGKRNRNYRRRRAFIRPV